jgi:hypothetical protein
VKIKKRDTKGKQIKDRKEGKEIKERKVEKQRLVKAIESNAAVSPARAMYSMHGNDSFLESNLVVHGIVALITQLHVI